MPLSNKNGSSKDMTEKTHAMNVCNLKKIHSSDIAKERKRTQIRLFFANNDLYFSLGSDLLIFTMKDKESATDSLIYILVCIPNTNQGSYKIILIYA